MVIECVYKEPPRFHFFETKQDKKYAKKLMNLAEQSLKKFRKSAEGAGIPIKTKVALTDSISEWVLNYELPTKLIC